MNADELDEVLTHIKQSTMGTESEEDFTALFEDMDLIVETYRTRKVSDKYSYDASLAEIAENDFNLNIPRYVDTFEEEEPVDLAAVATELKPLEPGMEESSAEIRGFCDELGIPSPV